MGDRCYMSVTCRRQDRERFEELGFQLEFESSPESLVVELVDEEANYAHANDLPTDIPYYGYHSAGGNYGDGKVACDGKAYAEVEAGQGGGFVVDWDYRNKKPTKQSLINIRKFIRVHKRTERIIKAVRESTVIQPHPPHA